MKKNNKIGIITFEKYEGRENIGSSRIRARWLTEQWEGAEILKYGTQYDVVIYQKCYWVEHAKLFKGIKIFDLCDPDWLHFGYRTIAMLEEVDAITTSTEALAKSIRKFTDKPVLCIPDRINLDKFSNKKKHSGQATYVGWFGYSTNFEMLHPVMPFIEKHNLSLVVISNQGFQPQANFKNVKVMNLKYNEVALSEHLLTCDFLINPQSTKGKWKYKSNNKTLFGWALGLPVASNVEELKRFIDPNERIKESKLRLDEINDKYLVKHSIEQYEKLIQDIKDSKK